MKKKNESKIIIFFLFIILVSLIIFNLYIMYENIDITNQPQYQASKTSLSTQYLQTVDKEEKNNRAVADMLEEVTRRCGWNFKIKYSWRFYTK